MNPRSLIGLLPLVFAGLAISEPDPPLQASRSHEGRVVLFGNLHAHSRLSDDVRRERDRMAPQDAFAYAREHGLDFLALSDHFQPDDAPGNPLQMDADEYLEQLAQVAARFRRTHPEFIAIPAIEFGTARIGNHLNLIGADAIPPDRIGVHEYEELYEWATDHVGFIQFNHPNSWPSNSKRDRDVGNYGEARYDSEAAFVDAVDEIVKTISVITTVAGGHITGDHAHSEGKTHRDAQWENYYQRYLNKGLHLSPAANQDTHWRNWGTVTAARTAAWVDNVSYEGLMDAFRANRVYATEDDELVVVFQVRHDDRVFWMGETVPLGQDDEVEALVRVWQVPGSDGDPTDEEPYTVEILSDWDGVGGRRATEWEEHDVPGDQLTTIPLEVVCGEYIYLRVTEQGGADNPVGEGEDTEDAATGALVADGFRDDLNDSAWTSPIWFACN
jgi:hypothetical protein